MQFLCCRYENSGKQRKTAENSGKQRQIPLFFRSPSRRKPRISAENAMSFADKFPAKTAKTAGTRPGAPSAPRMNASEEYTKSPNHDDFRKINRLSVIPAKAGTQGPQGSNGCPGPPLSRGRR